MKPNHKIKTNFRFDINALRAVAILGVVLYHYKVPHFDGGYTGVDIFFVISGFLMSQIIYRKLNLNEFRLNEFLDRRIKRIIPALLTLIIITSITAFFVLFPSDFQVLEKNASSSLLFLSNIWYWQKAGYFEPASDKNLLLHTWSLSVEWQFYLFLPLFIILLHKFFKNQKVHLFIFIIATLSGALLSFYITKRNPTASFYLLPTRCWEMMAGTVAYLTVSKFGKIAFPRIVAISGYLLILISVLFFKNSLLWPGKYTLIPVLGTFLVLIANVNNLSLIRIGFLQSIGTISYSLYLWHWPIYVLFIYFGYTLNLYSTTLLILIASFFGYLSYKYIESIPIFKLKTLLTLTLSTVIAVSSLGIISSNQFLFKDATVRLSNFKENYKKNRISQFSAGSCFISSEYEGKANYDKYKCLKVDTNQGNVLLIGDSHAAQLSQSLRDVLVEQKINVMQATASGCLPLVKLNGEKRCQSIMKYVYEDFLVKKHNVIDGAILTANWINIKENDYQKFLNELQQTVDTFKKYNIPLIIIGQNETYLEPYPTLAAKEYEYGKKIAVNALNPYAAKINQFLAKNFESYIDIYNYSRIPEISVDGTPYMFDENHLTRYGADIVTHKIIISPIAKAFFSDVVKLQIKRLNRKNNLTALVASN